MGRAFRRSEWCFPDLDHGIVRLTGCGCLERTGYDTYRRKVVKQRVARFPATIKQLALIRLSSTYFTNPKLGNTACRALMIEEEPHHTAPSPQSLSFSV